MFDEPEQDPAESSNEPVARAQERSDEFRMHAELAAVFEGNRKFNAEIDTRLDANLARDVQRAMGKLEKAKVPHTPVLPEAVRADAAALLSFPDTHNLSTNDYHIHHRPGETMIVRWLAGEQVDTYYDRLQAHFDAALEGFREDETQALEWRQDDATAKYLEALGKIEVKMADRYLRGWIAQYDVFVLSTQTADEINIEYLAGHLMNVTPDQVVGPHSAPPEGATERELGWFYKLFALRGIVDGVEKMCFFTYLQKSDDDFEF